MCLCYVTNQNFFTMNRLKRNRWRSICTSWMAGDKSKCPAYVLKYFQTILFMYLGLFQNCTVVMVTGTNVSYNVVMGRGERRDAESEVFWNFIIEFDHALQRGTKSSNATKVRPLPPYAAPWLVVLHCLLVHVKASISYSINCRQLLPSEEWPAYRKSGLRDFINIGVVKMTTAVTLVQHFKPLKFNGNCMYLDT